jgi:hypothetical protein
VHRYLLTLLLLATFACTPGDSSKVRPVGASVGAAAPDTAVSVPQPAPAAMTPAKKAQRAWDTAAPESFDVDELNRKRAEPKPEKPFIPLTRADTMKMLAQMKPDEHGAYSYMKPSDYPGLPKSIAGWLEERNYVIPQIVPPMDRHIKEEWQFQNAIKGEFIRPGQTDWAVYCTNGQNTEILLFKNAITDSLIVVKNYLQDYDELACCWYWINKIVPDNLTKYHRLKEDQHIEHAPTIKHEGIAVGSADYHHLSIYFDMGKVYLYESDDEE